MIKVPKKKYTPKQDVQLGKEAASEVRKQYPIIEDQHIAKYLTQIGNRLVAAAPTELKQSVYEYSFTPVNLKDINAFALPGGPMFVQRGMFDAAAEEAEVAGVMAHELSRVLLRHGTANASKAQNPWLQLGQIAGAVGGAVVGGELGLCGSPTFAHACQRRRELRWQATGSLSAAALAGADLSHSFISLPAKDAVESGEATKARNDWSLMMLSTGTYTSRQIYGPLTPELQKQREEYIFKQTGRKPTQRDQ